jgi:orotidine-5'-phosphate decarboxylase
LAEAQEGPEARAAPGHFADALVTRVRELGHPLCGGLDPHLDLIPPLFRRGSMSPRDPHTVASVEAFLIAVIDRLAGRVAVVKPQIAFFEQLGWRGLQLLEKLVAKARGLDLMVLLDAKRGDIGSTADGYVRAYLAADAAMPVDAITLNPYLGLDTLAPFANAAEKNARGLFVLAKTSNPGSGDFQDQLLAGEGAQHVSLFEAVAERLAPVAERLVGPQTGWSSLGVVMGATYPEQTDGVRQRLPKSLFLVPGYGSQGGAAGDAVRGFVPGPMGLEGGIVNSSRAILFPGDGNTDDAAQWESAIDRALDSAVTELGEAVGG